MSADEGEKLWVIGWRNYATGEVGSTRDRLTWDEAQDLLLRLDQAVPKTTDYWPKLAAYSEMEAL